MNVQPGNWVDFNDGYGWQKVAKVNTHYLTLEDGLEYPVDQVVEVRSAEEMEINWPDEE